MSRQLGSGFGVSASGIPSTAAVISVAGFTVVFVPYRRPSVSADPPARGGHRPAPTGGAVEVGPGDGTEPVILPRDVKAFCGTPD
ncbi:hypothetical protein Pen02_68850 [Plantactinospora endophytica]|uniref:Uncharacterized protein n=1 Tax=Plantactinospora endophytica TaxID=673535 RepID=A0ABQ4EB76_9ACTN|nr:hypothetical protein Pen02_68850 [Plantactinospora endophytica]